MSYSGPTYYGASLESLTYSADGFKDHNALAVSLATGLKLSPNFALEARLGLGLTEGSQSEYGEMYGYDYKLETEIKLNNYFGIYGIGLIPFNDQFSGHVKIGYATVSLKGKGIVTVPELNYQASDSSSVSESGFSYRFGGTYKLDNKMSVIAEYGSLPAGSYLEITLLSIGLNVNF